MRSKFSNIYRKLIGAAFAVMVFAAAAFAEGFERAPIETEPVAVDATDASMVELRIFLYVPEGALSDKQKKLVMQEISRIYKQAGMSVVFTDENVDFTVILVEKAETHPNVGKMTIAYTPKSPDGKRILNTGYVFMDRARDAAKDTGGNALATALYERNEEENLAIAIGRAASHEIGHYVLQQTYDSRSIEGVMNAGGRGTKWFTRETWVRSWTFDGKQKAIMHSFMHSYAKS